MRFRVLRLEDPFFLFGSLVKLLFLQQDLAARWTSGVAQALDAYKNGDTAKAYELAASAYLDNFEGLEGSLAKQDATLLGTIENQFKDLRDGIQAGKSLDDLTALATAIDANLDKAEQLLTSVNPASISMGFEFFPLPLQ